MRYADSELGVGVVGTQGVNGYKEALAKRLFRAVGHDVRAILEIGNL